jgi:glycosyltransferase involved in cell wall biosynthesis
MSIESLSAPSAIRIAHVTNEPYGPESANGVQQAVYCLARAQAELGASVAVFSRRSGRQVLRDSVGAAGQDICSSVRARASLREWALKPFLETSLLADVLAWRPDIVHLHSVHIVRNVALASALSRGRVPYCVAPHGGLSSAALQRGRLKKAVFVAAFERRYLAAAAVIHVLTPEEADDLSRLGVTAPIVVVPNGPPPDAYAAATEPGLLFERYPSLRGRRVFMFIGRLDVRQKGLDLLVEAFAGACLRNAALVLVGPDSEGSQGALEALANRLGVASQVVFAGPAFGEQRANLLAGADVFVHPSRWEGASLSVLAAAAAGKACIVTPAADPLGTLAHAGAAVIVNETVDDIAAGLRTTAALGGDDLVQMGLRAQQVVQAQFSWTTAAERLTAAYGVIT